MLASVSDSDYKEREYWDDYIAAFEDALSKCSTEHAPWFVIPANHKWFRNLAVSQIIAETMQDLGMKYPEPTVDLAEIRREYHQAAKAEKSQETMQGKNKQKDKKRAGMSALQMGTRMSRKRARLLGVSLLLLSIAACRAVTPRRRGDPCGGRQALWQAVERKNVAEPAGRTARLPRPAPSRCVELSIELTRSHTVRSGSRLMTERHVPPANACRGCRAEL